MTLSLLDRPASVPPVRDDVTRRTFIAPVISYEAASFGLLEPIRWLGDVLGRSEEAAQLEQEYNEQIAQRRRELSLDGHRIAVVNFGNYEARPTVQVFGPQQGFPLILNALGATYAPHVSQGSRSPRSASSSWPPSLPTPTCSSACATAVARTPTPTSPRSPRRRSGDPCLRSPPATSPTSTSRRPTATTASPVSRPPWTISQTSSPETRTRLDHCPRSLHHDDHAALVQVPRRRHRSGPPGQQRHRQRRRARASAQPAGMRSVAAKSSPTKRSDSLARLAMA